MTSNAVGETNGSASNATDLNSEDNRMVRIVIYGKHVNLPMDVPNLDVVRVCHVPKSLSSVKPEAFTPQFVGLGPYHHLRAELIMTDELKLSVANRVPNVKDLLQNNNFVFDNNIIRAFYHADVHTTCDQQTLLYVLVVDGLFLLGLLHRDADSHDSYFFTGKQGMPLVNAAGVELTLDAIVRDVFMLENQIPIHVLMKISRVNVNNMGIQQDNNKLGETMLNFCRPLCPLVYSEQVSPKEAEEDRVHLLDLMYHLVSPQHVPVPVPVPESQFNCCEIFRCIIVFSCFSLPILLFIVLYIVMYMLQLIIRWLVRPLFSKAIPWAVGPILGKPRKMPSLGYILRPFILLSFPFLKLNLQVMDSTNSPEEVVIVTIPSATKLGKFFIKVKPAEGGISSIRYDQPKLYLPPIRLDAVSEVIIRNLMAYESLTKSDDDLIFARYIDLLSALMLTSEDVKLLVRDKIIETQLSHEVVLQLFNGMLSKSIRPTKMAKLEAAIENINSSFNYLQTIRWFIVELIRFQVIFQIVGLFSPLMSDVVMGVLCLTRLRYTGFCNSGGVGDYGRNISSILSCSL